MSNGFLLKEQEFKKLNEELDLKAKRLLEHSTSNNLNKMANKKPANKVKRIIPKPRLDSPKAEENDSQNLYANLYANLPAFEAHRENEEDENKAPGRPPRGWHSKSNTIPKEKRELIHPASKKIPEPLQSVDENGEDEEKLLNNDDRVAEISQVPSQMSGQKNRFSGYETFDDSTIDSRRSEASVRPVKTVKPIKAANFPKNANFNPPALKRFRQPPSLPERMPKKNLSSDGLLKFLKGQVVILQEELEKSAIELHKKAEELEICLECQKKIESQRDQAIFKNNNLTGQLTKVEEKLLDVERRLKEREHELLSTNRELEILKREIRVTAQNNANLEKRVYRTNEELETTKAALNAARQNEREVKDELRKSNESYEKQIKILKKQKAELLGAYKKQLYLIDNLKRRNVCLEQAKLIAFSEKEFNKILEWNNKED